MTASNHIFIDNKGIDTNRKSYPNVQNEVKLLWHSKSWRNQMKNSFKHHLQQNVWSKGSLSKKKLSLYCSNFSLPSIKTNKLDHHQTKTCYYQLNWRIIRYLKLGLGFLMSAYALLIFDVQIGIIASFYLSQALSNTTGYFNWANNYIRSKKTNQDKNTIDIDFETIN